MNVAPDPATLVPEAVARPRRAPLRRLADLLLGKVATLVLAAIALVLGFISFVLLAHRSPFGLRPVIGVGMVLANLSVLLALGAVLAGRLTRVWVERRRGSAGAQLHVRLVMLFSVVAVAPTIVIAAFATAFFHFGIQAWFNDPVRAAWPSRRKRRAATSRSMRTTSAPSPSRWPPTWRGPATSSPPTPTVSAASWPARRHCAAYRGGDLRAGHRAGGRLRGILAGMGAEPRRPGRPSGPRPATSRWCRAATTRGYGRWCSSTRLRR